MLPATWTGNLTNPTGPTAKAPAIGSQASLQPCVSPVHAVAFIDQRKDVSRTYCIVCDSNP